MENHPAEREEQSNRKLRILLLAELCNPQWASVPLEALFPGFGGLSRT